MSVKNIERILLLGVGGYGTKWVRLLAGDQSHEVVGIVDISTAAIQQAVEHLGLDDRRVFSDLSTALAETRPDLVVDTTPPRFRLEWAREVFKHGAHLIVAKPLAERLSDATEMIALAEQHGCRVAVNQQQRYSPAAQVLADAVQSGRIGQHVCTYFTFFQRRQWQDRLLDVPSPLFVESSIHHFDLFRAVLGQNIQRVNAIGWTPPDIAAAGKTAGAAWLELQDGSWILYQASRSSRNDIDPGYGTGWQGPWIIEGTEGVLRGSEQEGMFLNGTPLITAQQIQQAHEETLVDTIFFQSFTEAVVQDKLFPLEANENIKTLAATFAAEMSIKSGSWISINDLLYKKDNGDVRSNQ